MQELTKTRLLAKNSLFNLVGQVAPAIVAIATIPLLIKGLGTERFGLLTLTWLLVGYFGLFDLGLGRALTQLVAASLGSGKAQAVSAIVWTALTIMAGLGVFGAVLIAALSSWIVHDVLRVSPNITQDAFQSLLLIACCVPMVVISTGLRGYLEALQRFDLINLIRVPLSIFTFLGPVLVLPLSRSLVAVVAVLTVGRLIGLIAHFWFCFRISPAFRRFTFQRDLIARLLKFGGWLTVSSVIGPFMVYLDRFLIGALVAVSAVAYYTTPYEVVSKMGLISTAFMGVLFPALSSTYVADRVKARQLYLQGLKYTALILFPIAFVCVMFASEGIRIWLGNDFSQNSYRIMQILAIGMFANNLALSPFTLTQGAGRPDLAAKLHIIELPVYLATLWFMANHFGIIGIAVAWAIRALVDALVLFVLGFWLLGAYHKEYVSIFGFILILHGLLFTAIIPADIVAKLIWSIGVMILVLSAFFVYVLDTSEKELVRRTIRHFPAMLRSRFS